MGDTDNMSIWYAVHFFHDRKPSRRGEFIRIFNHSSSKGLSIVDHYPSGIVHQTSLSYPSFLTPYPNSSPVASPHLDSIIPCLSLLLYPIHT
ncbi:hypothetical protein EYC84_010891 [Monilinia fructicola]|uniref:Uncharacterized protein n=1 Tax=Monilinia fructicola TaxID=38448 RepID=A0A5M9JD45_MONFR|nr:hypothetical protein EYC84_010891 [Monilinia fructicola]